MPSMNTIPLLPALPGDARTPLLEMTLPELTAWLAERGEPAFRARQVWEWIYKRFAADFASMTNLPKALRERLDGEASLLPFAVATEIVSLAGDTVKTLFTLRDGQTIEAVLMLYDERRTV